MCLEERAQDPGRHARTAKEFCAGGTQGPERDIRVGKGARQEFAHEAVDDFGVAERLVVEDPGLVPQATIFDHVAVCERLGEFGKLADDDKNLHARARSRSLIMWSAPHSPGKSHVYLVYSFGRKRLANR